MPGRGLHHAGPPAARDTPGGWENRAGPAPRSFPPTPTGTMHTTSHRLSPSQAAVGDKRERSSPHLGLKPPTLPVSTANPPTPAPPRVRRPFAWIKRAIPSQSYRNPMRYGTVQTTQAAAAPTLHAHRGEGNTCGWGNAWGVATVAESGPFPPSRAASGRKHADGTSEPPVRSHKVYVSQDPSPFRRRIPPQTRRCRPRRGARRRPAYKQKITSGPHNHPSLRRRKSTTETFSSPHSPPPRCRPPTPMRTTWTPGSEGIAGGSSLPNRPLEKRMPWELHL